jgi:predicted esterase
VGFHGQGQTADAFLTDLERVPREGHWLVASIQGLNRYYAGRSRSIVASWMTSQDRELAIADNVRWVDTVLDELEREFGAPQAIVYAGFSQGVAMAYRAGLLGRRPCAAIVSVCGDVPPELKSGTTNPWPRVLAMTGSHDEWYTPARLEEDLAHLRMVRPDPEGIVFHGGHEWSDEVAAAVGRLLAAIPSLPTPA